LQERALGYLYVKAFHIFFVVSWFAGLFYLPRLFVNLAMVKDDGVEYERLLAMAQKLYRFMTPLGILAIVFGLWLWLGYGISGAWLHAKLVLVLALVLYHGYCGRIWLDFSDRRNRRDHVWFRVFNEAPTLLLLAITILVVVKPF
jgi:protoporphyrinogen IX oxidase